MNNSRRVVVIGGMILASGAAGFALGKARSPVELRETSEAPFRSAGDRRAAPPKSREGDGDPFLALERLLTGDGGYAEIGAVVSRIPPAKMPELVARMRDLASAPPDGMNPAMIREIAKAMYFRWAETDPRAACQDAGKWPVELERHTMVRPALVAWISKEGIEGYQAMKKDGFYGFHAGGLLVRTWGSDNLLENLARFPDQAERDQLFSQYCSNCVEVPEKREALLRLLHERKDLNREGANFRQVFRAWSYIDFDAAMLSAREQGIEGLQEHIIDGTMNVSAEKAMPAAVSRGMEPQPSWEAGYENWCYTDPAGAKAWLAGQKRAWNESGHQDTVANFLTKQWAWDNASGNSADREASLKQLSAHWSEWRDKDANAAERWLEAAKAELREGIAKEGGAR